MAATAFHLAKNAFHMGQIGSNVAGRTDALETDLRVSDQLSNTRESE